MAVNIGSHVTIINSIFQGISAAAGVVSGCAGPSNPRATPRDDDGLGAVPSQGGAVEVFGTPFFTVPDVDIGPIPLPYLPGKVIGGRSSVIRGTFWDHSGSFGGRSGSFGVVRGKFRGCSEALQQSFGLRWKNI